MLLFSEHALARLAVGPDEDRGGKGLGNGISELNMLLCGLVHELVDAPRHSGHADDGLVWHIHLHGNLLVLNRQAIHGGQPEPVSEHAQSLDTLLVLYLLQKVQGLDLRAPGQHTIDSPSNKDHLPGPFADTQRRQVPLTLGSPIRAFVSSREVPSRL